MKLITNVPIDKIKIEGQNGVERIDLANGGDSLEAANVIVDLTGAASIELAEEAGLTIDRVNEAIKVNPFLQTSDPHIFAAGDTVLAPDWITGSRVRNSNLQTAQGHGCFSALNM